MDLELPDPQWGARVGKVKGCGVTGRWPSGLKWSWAVLSILNRLPSQLGQPVKCGQLTLEPSH